MDYRLLLKKYIEHVLDHEGTTFITDIHKARLGVFTDAEWADLEKLRDEDLAEMQRSSAKLEHGYYWVSYRGADPRIARWDGMFWYGEHDEGPEGILRSEHISPLTNDAIKFPS